MTRVVRIVAPAALVVASFAALLIALAVGGAAAPQLLQDPGDVVRYGLPVAQMIVNIAAAGMIGALGMALFVFRAGSDEYGKTLDIAAAASALFTVSAAVTGFFNYLSVTARTVSLDDSFSQGLGQFLTQIALGQAWLWTTLLGAVLTVLCFAVRNQTALFFVGLLSAAALIPMAQQGHASGTEGHDAAVTALALHIIFAAAWLGGLLVLALLSRRLETLDLVAAVSRYSAVALICFVVVALSGYVSAQLRIGTLDQLASAYGALVLVKVGALLALGVIGALHRTFLVRRLDRTGHRGYFWWLVAVEMVFMGIATGFAAALGRTATPVSEEIPVVQTPAQILTGEPLPPEPSFLTYLTSWNFDLLWVLVCGFGIAFYLAGVIKLRRRGDAWPWYRSVLWVAGMLLLFWVTNGGLNVYEKYLFSVHMFGHMTLSMMVPLLLVPAGPVTLALRAIDKRSDGTRGIREWILLAVHSRVATVIANPIVAGVLFATSLVAFYYTPLFRWATVDHIGHEWMIVHFLIVGYLFVQALIGIDPVPYKLPYPFRLLLLLATMAFHAFFGLALMSGTGLLMADWFGAMGRTWGPSALVDQQNGGGVAWSVGEIPTFILAVVVAVQWSMSDKKEAKRKDRAADRTNNAELAEYNAMLEKLSARDGGR
ncbi:bifunctional copper resistance protein CopD/cytochrome c oxidase assembly protein [Cnuibacter physcomitrellae]|uniref:bifunctional copper resistance protein CopD/cytochrome c oxidase assembly protein n=1 Tax=Cnuibacter physcomitrellae TaxID=1619308 RepID=UPI002175E772|nr:bifunctional copper resistance protein CopD/cytochrome c oxidase assembly protein [Cnuibacter physcomitrellae]MCS5497565.1 bifunctional copper resistance protein CopD/cytochrome c oxidase assembly protein [Cnuibacter physcomitrellae]